MKQVGDGFWNFRGSFHVAKIIDVGTQMSLVRRANGRFLLLDSYELDTDDYRELMALTSNGAAIDAILNVHPFHTLHCRAVHNMAPEARLIGTARHRVQAPDLRWESGVIEDPETQAEFLADLEFSVPRGADLVTSNENVHASSVLVRHKASGVVHVDDTLNVFAAPGALGKVLPQSRLRFHPTFSKALEHRPGAADEFAAWASELAEGWASTRVVCAAHSAVRNLPADGWRTEVLQALADLEKMLAAHRERYG